MPRDGAEVNPQGADGGFPTGTVTFSFGDVGGSTRLLQADPGVAGREKAGG